PEEASAPFALLQTVCQAKDSNNPPPSLPLFSPSERPPRAVAKRSCTQLILRRRALQLFCCATLAERSLKCLVEALQPRFEICGQMHAQHPALALAQGQGIA